MIVAEAIQSISQELGLDVHLVLAIATVESNLSTWPCRFEPQWKYFVDVDVWGIKLGQSFDTERTQQQTSWGAMQVMGSVARELGFTGYLNQLCVPEIGIRYACLKLKALQIRFKEELDVISSYNQGSPRKSSNGQYLNQGYVDKVMENLSKFREHH